MAAPVVSTAFAPLAHRPETMTGRTCARHPRYSAHAACRCGALLCWACAGAVHHARCPTCRKNRGEAPSVVDFRWRLRLLVEGLREALRVVPGRFAVVLGLVALSLAGAGTILLLGERDEEPTVELGPLEPLLEQEPDAAGAAVPVDTADTEVADPTLDSDGDGLVDDVERQWSARVVPAAPCLDGLPDDDGDERRRLRAAARIGGCLWQEDDDLEPWEDDDSDGDGVSDKVEGVADRNDNGIADFVDPEAHFDAAGLPPAIANRRPDASTDVDHDWLSTERELAAGTSPFAPDSDGDGVSDALEAPRGERRDTDKDGAVDGMDDDADGDGVADSAEGLWVELDEEPWTRWVIDDVDGDLVPDRLDLDDDGDGIPTSIESSQSCGCGSDGGDEDHDYDGVPNHLDQDSDGDGEPDVVEGTFDRDGDGGLDFVDEEVALASPEPSDDGTALLGLFLLGALVLAMLFQPFLVVPGDTLRGRLKGAAFATVSSTVLIAVTALIVDSSGDLSLGSAATMFVPLLLTAQARLVDGASLRVALVASFTRAAGTVVALVLFAGATSFFMITIGLVSYAVLAELQNGAWQAFLTALVGSVVGLVWLVASGGFARASARYSEDTAP